jgi:high affinity sulfate transporter 1
MMDPVDKTPRGPMAEPEPAATVQRRSRWLQRVPGLVTLREYRREWLPHDLAAGAVLTAILVPVGMGYAQASGVPALYGLYATIVPLLAYALFGPSRILVLGPDSTLAAVIAAIIVPLAAGSPDRAVALAGALALLSGAFLLLISVLRLGVMADLFSKPIRLGFLNAIALTVIVSQLPRLMGFTVRADSLPERLAGLVQGIAGGRVNGVALAVGAASLALILGLKHLHPRLPGVLVAVVGATLASALLGLAQQHGLTVVGPMPRGLPLPAVPAVSARELTQLVAGAAVIALLIFADTSVLSRALAGRHRTRVDANQEMLAVGMANLAAGLFQGFPVSASSSRTPVAEAAGARTQLTGVVGAVLIALLLILAPGLLQDLPSAALAAVVIAACLSFADIPAMTALLRQRRIEFVLSLTSFLGVAFVGVIEGIVIAILLSLLVLVWNAWHPYHAVLARVDGRKGYHDVQRHPEGRFVPGLVLFRWDAELFFANAEIFRSRLLAAVERAPTPTRCVIVAADAITDIDITASECLAELDRELERDGIQLRFAGLKGPVKDWLIRYGLGLQFDPSHFDETVGSGVNQYRRQHPVDWKDWDEA